MSVVLRFLLSRTPVHTHTRTHVSSYTRTLVLSYTLALFPGVLVSQVHSGYFYHGDPYGSEALFNPISVIVNGGCDSFQQLERSSAFSQIPWRNGSTSVWRSITSPLPVISDFGWNRFLRQEVFPGSLKMEELQWVPNYGLHLIGGGMVSRKLTEWYDAHGYPAPAVLGAVTSMTAEFFNEVVENGVNIYPNEDCIPDLLIFQPLGIVLFSFDGVAEYFSDTFSLNDWSQPAAISFAPLAFRNAGQNFVMKYALTGTRSTSLFVHFGNFVIGGLSFRRGAQDAISFGVGQASTGVKVLPVVNGVPSNTIDTGVMAGVYYDRNNSLLGSVVYTAARNQRFRVNVYPGVLTIAGFSPGLFLTIIDGGGYVAGVTLAMLPLGLSLHTPAP